MAAECIDPSMSHQSFVLLPLLCKIDVHESTQNILDFSSMDSVLLAMLEEGELN